MKIEQSISQLLYRYQCVTVPGFGAFLTEIQSAQLHENTNSFYPPKKQISFNSSLKNNDGLLATHISKTEKSSYENAVIFIQSEVDSWKNKLNEYGTVSIKNVGEITLNSNKNMVFTPTEQVNYLTSSFGLNSFVSPLVKREVFEKHIEAFEEKALIKLIPETKKSNSYLKYAAVFLLTTGIAGIGTYGGYKFYENKIAEETLVVQTNVQKQVDYKIQEATFFISNPLPAVTLTLKEEKRTLKLNYHVVAGAFRLEKNAQKSFLELTKKGFNARRIAKSKYGLYPVLYGSFSSYIEAKKFMTDIQNTQNPDSWMLIKEL
jgi:GR25 family glycosyltransferase involved in LPS biosynthesis